MFAKHLLLVAALSSPLLGMAAPVSAPAPAPGIGPNLVVKLAGTGVAETRLIEVPGDGLVEATCFDLELIDVASGRVIGTGSDCLFDIQPAGAGLSLVDATFFHFRSGTIVARSEVAAQPTSMPMPGVSHLVGALSDEPNVVGGTGAFRNATGSVRLSGMVDMSRLMTEGEMDFNCLFVIDLD